MYRLAEGSSPLAANTIGIQVVAFLTTSGLMGYRPSILDLHSARSTNQIGLVSRHAAFTRILSGISFVRDAPPIATLISRPDITEPN